MALNINDKEKIYESLKRNIDISEIKELYPNINENDLDMIFVASIYDVFDNIQLKLVEGINKKRKFSDVAKETITGIKENVLENLGYFNRIKFEYNSRFDKRRRQYELECNSYDNPFFLSKARFDNQFKNFEEDSDIQLYAKAVYWSNSATKQIDAICQNVVSGINNKCGTYGKMISLKNECMLETVEENYNLKDEYILLYQRYLEDDITKEELENDETYKMLENILSQKSDKINVSMEDVYKFFSLEDCVQIMYKVKNTFAEELMKKYSSLEKGDSKNEEIKIYQSENNDDINKLSGKEAKQFLTLLVKGTNTPLKIHLKKGNFQNICDTHEIEIPQGEIELGARNVMYLTYDKNQQEKIRKMNGSRIRASFDLDVWEYVQMQYDMCNDLDAINIKKNIDSLDNVEKKDEKEKDDNVR